LSRRHAALAQDLSRQIMVAELNRDDDGDGVTEKKIKIVENKFGKKK
jgi:hypothetical protein